MVSMILLTQHLKNHLFILRLWIDAVKTWQIQQFHIGALVIKMAPFFIYGDTGVISHLLIQSSE